ncbi:hypothetical protein, partial [Thiolapillus sp.]|uniref:hypothetical protein n=1 Tax=Thiolapillus sp. TaxID=2017437 RepID=UPI003AF98DE8
MPKQNWLPEKRTAFRPTKLLKLLSITRLGQYPYRKPPTNFSVEAQKRGPMDPFFIFGGEGGIRTLDTGLPYTHFPG